MVLLTLALRLFRGPSGAVLFMLLAVAIFGCQCGNQIPQNDICSSPDNTGVDTLELGPGGEGAFRPFTADEKLEPVRGGQGASMLTFRLRAGPKPPQCLGQKTTVSSAFDPTDTFASFEQGAATYEETGGKRVTKTMYLIGSFGPVPSRVHVVTTVGQVKLEQSFAVVGSNGCSAIAGCRQSCKAECDQCAAGATAAALTALEDVDTCVAMYCDADAGTTGCRDAVIQTATECQTVWDTCQSTP